MTTTTLDEFVSAYLAAAIWSSTGDDDEPLDANYSADDLAPEALEQARTECDAFLSAHADVIGDRIKSAGHDFWLTRCGHGAGFWDGDWDDGDDSTVADRLTAAAHAAGSRDIYSGDDGRLYFA